MKTKIHLMREMAAWLQSADAPEPDDGPGLPEMLDTAANDIDRLTTEVREANHEKHMAVVKKLSEISALKGGWLDAIKAIDWFEEQTAEPCEPYPQSERDEDREWLEDTSASSKQQK